MGSELIITFLKMIRALCTSVPLHDLIPCGYRTSILAVQDVVSTAKDMQPRNVDYVRRDSMMS
jgi:hypothetical protein